LRVRKKRNPKNPIFSSSLAKREQPPPSLWILGSHSQNQGPSLSSPSPISLNPHFPSRHLLSLSPLALFFSPHRLTSIVSLFPFTLSQQSFPSSVSVHTGLHKDPTDPATPSLLNQLASSQDRVRPSSSIPNTMAPTDPDLSTCFLQLLPADVVPFLINQLSFSGSASYRRFGLRPNH
jgi:hypothetical protein